MKRLTFIFIALLAIASNAMADNLKVNSVKCNPGATIDVPVELINSKTYTVFEMSVQLPNGFELLDVTKSERFKDGTFFPVTKKGDGSYGIVTSSFEASITGNSGTLLTLTIKVPSTAKDNYAVTIKDILFGDANAQGTQMNNVSFTITVEDSDSPIVATCAEVLSGSDGKTYQVSGTVKSITNTTYGNWYLKDATGEIYIYGTRDKNGNTGQNNSIAAWDIEVGDEVTVEGPRTTYNGQIELVDVSIISIRKSPKEAKVTLSSAGYATFYSSKSAYKLPSGLSAKVVKGADNGKLTYETIIVIDGSNTNIVPKGIPVMIESSTRQAGTFSLTATESSATYTGANLLRGCDETTTTVGNGYHYKLSYGPSGTKWSDVFGWYWGAQSGAPFLIEGHRAWLVLPRNGTRAAGFTIEGDGLDVEVIDHSPLTTDCYYDLQGRRIMGVQNVSPSKKGVYIRNGQKVVVK